VAVGQANLGAAISSGWVLHGHITEGADGAARFLGAVCLPHSFHLAFVGSITDNYGGHGGNDCEGLHLLAINVQSTQRKEGFLVGQGSLKINEVMVLEGPIIHVEVGFGGHALGGDGQVPLL